MGVAKILNNLYESELNCELSFFWDAGWDVKLGDSTNGYKAEKGGFDLVEEAVQWLADEVAKIYPKSEFSEWWRGLNKKEKTKAKTG